MQKVVNGTGQSSDGDEIRQDSVFQLGALAVMGAVGIVLNVVIGSTWGAAALGIFNQVFAIYVFLSQISVAGIHNATLKFVSEHNRAAKTRTAVVFSALLLGTGFSVFGTTVFWMASDVLATLLEAPAVGIGMEWAAAGFFLFAINKILLATINGRRLLRAYALILVFRYLGILATAAAVVMAGFDSAVLPSVFTVAETLVFVLALPIALKGSVIPRCQDIRKWTKTLFPFGIKSAPAGMLWELNTRIDVLCVGFFMADAAVGIYSFAAIFAEGFFQILVALRAVFNPRIVGYIAAGEIAALERMVARVRRVVYMAMASLWIAAIAVYPWMLTVFGLSGGFAGSWLVFAVLSGGVVAASGYIPFNNTLMLAGYPGWHSIYYLMILVANTSGNVALIPAWGISGAAVATAASVLISAVALRVMVRRRSGVRL